MTAARACQRDTGIVQTDCIGTARSVLARQIDESSKSAIGISLRGVDFFAVWPGMWPTVRVGAEKDFVVTPGDDGAGNGGRALVMLDREGWRELVQGMGAARVQELIAPAG